LRRRRERRPRRAGSVFAPDSSYGGGSRKNPFAPSAGARKFSSSHRPSRAPDRSTPSVRKRFRYQRGEKVAHRRMRAGFQSDRCSFEISSGGVDGGAEVRARSARGATERDVRPRGRLPAGARRRRLRRVRPARGAPGLLQAPAGEAGRVAQHGAVQPGGNRAAAQEAQRRGQRVQRGARENRGRAKHGACLIARAGTAPRLPRRSPGAAPERASTTRRRNLPSSSAILRETRRAHPPVVV
jgi:hypothetical protein